MDIKVDAVQMMTNVPECCPYAKSSKPLYRMTSAVVKKSYNYRLARHKRSAAPRHQAILVIQG